MPEDCRVCKELRGDVALAGPSLSRALVDDLPDAVAAPEAADEEHLLRQTRARQEGTKSDVDDDRAPPYAGAALVLRLTATLMIACREVCRDNLRLS